MTKPRDADYYRKWRKKRSDERKANPPIVRCDGCAREFAQTNPTQKYHDAACRQKAHRNRHGRRTVTALRNTVTPGVVE
jgi:hypothetical protein